MVHETQRRRPVRLLFQQRAFGHLVCVPNFDGAVVRRRNKSLAIGRKCEIQNYPFVGEQGIKHGVGGFGGGRADVPYTDSIIRSSRGQTRAIWSESDGVELFE